MDWMVRDEHGNVWPPGFRSRLTSDKDPLRVVMSAKESTSLDNLRAGQKIAWDMFSGKNKPNQVNTPKAPSRNPEIRDKIIEVLRKRSLTAAELARMFQTTRPNMHKILRRMEDKGMLRAMRNDVILVNGTKTYRWTTESRKT